MAAFIAILAVILISITLFCHRSIKADAAISKALQEVARTTSGVPVRILGRSNPDQKGVRSTVVFALAGKNLILTGRGFLSPGVAKRLTDSGGAGTLWETTVKGRRVGLLRSAGLEYWGEVTEEYPAQPDDQSSRSGIDA